MGSLISFITAVTQAKFGVNILEVTPPAGVQGRSTNVVGIIGHFPWGPIDTPTEITSTGELFDAFGPLPFAVLNAWASFKAFINKTFPNTILVCRISPSGQVKATKDFDDATPGGQQAMTVTAKWFGSVGNQINITITNNADNAANRDVTVSIGTAYSVTYKNVCTASPLAVVDPGDPYVTMALASGTPVQVPVAIAATPLAGGADGSPVAGDYSAAMDAFEDANLKWNVLLVAEPTNALVDDINNALEQFVIDNNRGFVILNSPSGETSAQAKTAVAARRHDRLMHVWPRVFTLNGFDPLLPEVEVDGNAFAAAAIAGVDPEISPGGAPGAPFMKGITRLSLPATLITLNDLNDNGIAPFYIDDSLGPIIHKAVTTSLTPALTRVSRRRMTDYLTGSIADYLVYWVGRPLDLDLTNKVLGPVTGPEISGLRQFLADLKATGRIRDFAVDEFTGNTQTNINNGQWIILVAVQLISAQEEIILQATIGESVQVALLQQAA